MNKKTHILSSFRCLILSRIVTQTFRWVLTFVIIRLLSPDYYGLMGLSESIFAFILLIGTSGVTTSLIQVNKYTNRQLKEIFSFIIIVNMVISLLLYVSAPYLQQLYLKEGLQNIIRVLILGLLINSLGIVPLSILARDMHFKFISFVQLLSGVLGSIITLFFAYFGFGVWSLVYGYLCDLFIRNIMYLIRSPNLFTITFRINNSFKLIKYGSYATLCSILWFIYTYIDVFIAGKIWSSYTLGIYIVALQIATIPLNKVMPIIRQVALPAYSSYERDGNSDISTNYCQKINSMSFFISLPVFFGISSVSSEVGNVLLGHAWSEISTPLKILSLILPLRVSFEIIQPLLISRDKIKVVLCNHLTSLIITVPILIFGAHKGLIGLAISWLISYPIVYIVNMLRTLKALNIKICYFYKGITSSILSSLIMYLIVYLFDKNYIYDQSVFKLMFMCFIGLVTYITMQYILNGNECSTYYKILFKKQAMT